MLRYVLTYAVEATAAWVVQSVEDLAVRWLLLPIIGLAHIVCAQDTGGRRHRVCSSVQVFGHREVCAHFVSGLLVGDVTEGLAKVITLSRTVCRCVLLKQAALVLGYDRFSGCILAFVDHYLLVLLIHFPFYNYSKIY